MWKHLHLYAPTDLYFFSASAESIARVYNLALGISELPNASRLSHQLTGELVLDTFFCHTVLRDKSMRHEILHLPHRGSQRHRLDDALRERNFRMIGTGQEMWAHTCNRCMKVYQGEDGNWCMFMFLFLCKLYVTQNQAIQIKSRQGYTTVSLYGVWCALCTTVQSLFPRRRPDSATRTVVARTFAI